MFVLSRSNATFFFRALFLQEKGLDKYKYTKMQKVESHDDRDKNQIRLLKKLQQPNLILVTVIMRLHFSLSVPCS